MQSVGKLNVLISATSQALDKELDRTQKRINQFNNQAGRGAANPVSNFFQGVAELASKAFSFVGALAGKLVTIGGTLGAGAAALVGWGVKLAAEAEQAQISFEVILKSADKAKTLLAEITEFAAATPYESPELVASARQMLAFGVAADQVMPSLKAMGEIAAGVNQPIQDITHIFGQVVAGGRMMNLQLKELTHRGIDIMTPLAKEMGVDKTQIRKLAEEGQVHVNHFIGAINRMHTGTGTFAGMMARQSKSLSGLWSTLADNFKLTLRGVGEAAIKGLRLKESIKIVSDYFDSLRTSIAGKIEPIFQVIGGVLSGVFDTAKAAAEDFFRYVAGAVGIDSWLVGFDKAREAVIKFFEAATIVAGNFLEMMAVEARNVWFILKGVGETLNYIASIGTRAVANIPEGPAARMLREMEEQARGRNEEIAAQAGGGALPPPKDWREVVHERFRGILASGNRGLFDPIVTRVNELGGKAFPGLGDAMVKAFMKPQDAIGKLLKNLSGAKDGIAKIAGIKAMDVITEQMSPAEKFKKEFEKFQGLSQAEMLGARGDLVFARGMDKALQALMPKAEKITAPSGLERGSKEAISAAIQFERQGMGTGKRDLAAILEEQLKAEREDNARVLEQLKELQRVMRGIEPVGVVG